MPQFTPVLHDDALVVPGSIGAHALAWLAILRAAGSEPGEIVGVAVYHRVATAHRRFNAQVGEGDAGVRILDHRRPTRCTVPRGSA